MRKLLAVFLASVMLLCSCQKNSSRELLEEEITQVNDAFFFMTENEAGEIVSNPLPCFLMDYYENVKEMPLKNFLLYFPSDGDVTEADEFEALKSDPDFPFADVPSLDEMPVPIHRISVDSLDAYLQKNAGIITEDLINKENTIYLEEYNAYYTTTSDAGGAFFNCESGVYSDDSVELFGSSSAGYSSFKMIKSGENWIVSSHLIWQNASAK